MPTVDGGGVVYLPGEARTIDVGGFSVIVHADSGETVGAFSLIETGDPRPGAGPPLHVHHDAAESFFVIDGEYAFHLDGRDFECAAGSFVYVPRGMSHTFRSTRPRSRKLNLFTPAAMVGYFDELAEGIRNGMDEAALDGIAERYGMTVLGPAPVGYLDPGAPEAS